MKKLILGVLIVSVVTAFGQRSILEGIPYAKREQAEALNAQASALFDSAKPAVAEAAKSTVIIYSGRRSLCLGTVVEGGKVLAKASELTTSYGPLFAVDSQGNDWRLENAKVDPEYDLAVFDYQGDGLPEIKLNGFSKAKLGQMVFLASPNSNVLGFGVVSVLPHSLRFQDKGFLGVGFDRFYNGDGIGVDLVVVGSPAFKAGIKKGDALLEINGRKLDSMTEARIVLERLKPGGEISLKYSREGKELKATATLVSRPESRTVVSDRTRYMQRLGTRINEVNDAFPNVIQTDMQIQPEECGGPVTNLDGELVGIAISRSSRIKTYIIPTEVIKEILGLPANQLQEIQPLVGQPKRSEGFEAVDVKEADSVLAQQVGKIEELLEQVKGQAGEKEGVALRIGRIENLLAELKDKAEE